MLICARMANRCVTHCLAAKPSEARLELSRRFSQACLVCPERDAKKTQSLCEIRTIGTGEPTSEDELFSEDSEIDASSAAEGLHGQALDMDSSARLMADNDDQWDQLKKLAPEEINQNTCQAEDTISVKTLTARDKGASSIAYQSRKGYHDIRRRRFSRRSSGRFGEDKDSTSAPGTTDDYDHCISLAVDDILAGCLVSEAGWFHESWITNEANSPLAEDERTGPAVRYNNESYDLADFTDFLESIEETKSFAASEIEALFKEYVASTNTQLEADRTVYDECMNQAVQAANILNDAGDPEFRANTLSPNLSVYKACMRWKVRGKGGLRTRSKEEWVPAPTNLSGSKKGANQVYLDEMQSVWHRDRVATSTDALNADQETDMADAFNTEIASKIFFDKMQSMWDHNRADYSTSTSRKDQDLASTTDADSDFGEFLRCESEAPEAINTIKPYRPFKTIQVPADSKATRSKISTGLDKSLKSLRPAAPKAPAKPGKGIRELPADKLAVTKGDAKGRRLHTNLTETQSHTQVVLAVLQQALDELKSGKSRLKTTIKITKPEK
ncbi:GL10872 [Drosophila persimilis]|uniref:GL10872 n=2 Tax=Drosophila persimilis TaxID=7234 RepID=B4GDD0_DROPE|nr:GL10872 [Drosophila persimilis]